MQIPIHGDGQATRSYMHVDDAARRSTSILHKGSDKGVYNIGAHEERTVLSVAQDIGKSLGVDVSKMIVHVNDRSLTTGGTSSTAPSSTRSGGRRTCPGRKA